MKHILHFAVLACLCVSHIALAQTAIDQTWKIKDPKLAQELAKLFGSVRDSADRGDVSAFQQLLHPYRLQEMLNGISQTKSSLTPDFLKTGVAPLLNDAVSATELTSPKFLKATKTTAIVLFEHRDPDQPPPNDRGYVAIEYLKDAGRWKFGKISIFPFSVHPELPENLTLTPRFPPLTPSQTPEIVGYVMLHSIGFSGTVSLNGGTAMVVKPGLNMTGVWPEGFKKNNDLHIVLEASPKDASLKPAFEVTFLTKGKASMTSQFQKSFDVAGDFKTSFAVQ